MTRFRNQSVKDRMEYVHKYMLDYAVRGVNIMEELVSDHVSAVTQPSILIDYCVMVYRMQDGQEDLLNEE